MSSAAPSSSVFVEPTVPADHPDYRRLEVHTSRSPQQVVTTIYEVDADGTRLRLLSQETVRVEHTHNETDQQ
ncbi:MAG: hypothetical protein Q7V62_04910 [Actinomycetota bacterium]|nr:hypothetical protein [Actinomycetota bacterium]